MNSGLATGRASTALISAGPSIASFFEKVDTLRFADANAAVTGVRSAIAAARCTASEPDDDIYLTDLFALESYASFLDAYRTLWERIVQQQFSASWSALQDALDYLRVIKRFSSLQLGVFEDQLLELEKLYPYKLFLSVGITVEGFDCSICGADVDSPECPHLRGRLYKGVMAKAIARDVTAIDHIAMVANPEDKRCVISYEDSSEQFRLVRFLASLLLAGRCHPLSFSHLRMSKRRLLNPDYVKLGRNDRCFCGSGKKFKRCCELKRYVENDHVDIVVRPLARFPGR
jgi:hypothetical protein